MPKVCTACGLTLDDPQKPADQSEDCPSCGTENAVAQQVDENGDVIEVKEETESEEM